MDTVTKRNPTTQLRERIKAVLTERVLWGVGTNPDTVIDSLVAAVGELTAKQALVMTCSIHGEIAREEVWCQHDIEEAMRRVANAHGASYGANCTGQTLTVELLEP